MVIPATERATDHWPPYGDSSMNTLRRITGWVLYALILAGAGALAPAGAQVNTGDPNVDVDLSVLEDAGYGAAPVYAPAGPVYLPASPIGRRLLMPGPENPVSQLHVPPVRGKKAKSSRRAKAAALAAKRKRKAAAMPKKAALAPPPAKAPKKPPVTISAVPAPLIAPPPPPARPAPVKKGEPAPTAKPTAAPSAALTPPPPPPMMTETAAKTKKTPAARPGGKPKAGEKAALPPAGMPLAPGRTMQIVFKSTASKLPDTAKAGLKTLAAKLKGQPTLRLQLMAYAGGESLSSGKARRLSLSRALSVRSYLIENGVRSTRIDVRALGNKTAEEPLNRVDVTVAER
jgi:outer membrane protein OmpA-like peptidoglycan-associated protein